MDDALTALTLLRDDVLDAEDMGVVLDHAAVARELWRIIEMLEQDRGALRKALQRVNVTTSYHVGHAKPMTVEQVMRLRDIAREALASSPPAQDGESEREAAPAKPHWPTVAATMREVALCMNEAGTPSDTLFARAAEIAGRGE